MPSKDKGLARGTGWLILGALLGAVLAALGMLSGLGALMLPPFVGWSEVTTLDWLSLVLGTLMFFICLWAAHRLNSRERSRDEDQR